MNKNKTKGKRSVTAANKCFKNAYCNFLNAVNKYNALLFLSNYSNELGLSLNKQKMCFTP